MTNGSKEPVYILIPVHNRKQTTLACLGVLGQNGDLERYHVVIVDDGSTDGTAEAIHSLYPDITILRVTVICGGQVRSPWECDMPTNTVQSISFG